MKHLKIKKEGHICWVYLNRPKSLNALNTEILKELTQFNASLRDDLESRVVIYTGNGENFSSIGLNKSALYLVLAGVALSISIIAYYIALSRGPVSIVAPIFAMNFAVAGVLGFMFLGENLTIARVTGVALAAAAIILLAR